MQKYIVSLVSVGALCAASLPASAQIRPMNLDSGVAPLPVTQAAFHGGARFRPGGHGGWRGGHRGWRGGYGGRGGYGWNRHRGFGIGAGVAGLAAGALIGGAIASQATPYYGAPAYGPPVAEPDGNAIAYCMQRFKSFDPNSGTYLGYDGQRHPCP